MTRIALIDGHRVLRDGLVAMLHGHEGLEVVGSYDTVGQLIEGLGDEPLHVVVLEAHLPDGSGLECVERIKRQAPAVRVLVLTGSHADADLMLALQLPVDGYLYKECSGRDLVRAVRGSAEDGFFVGSHAARQLRELAVGAGDGALTSREVAVLRAVREGLTTEEIAARLILSTSTVKTHLGSLYRKLEARNRVEAVREAERRGLLGHT